MNFIAKLLQRYILKLPPGIDYVDGRFLVDMTKFKPGMKPFEMDYKNGKAYFNEYGTRIETKNGGTHWHWRDGKVDRYVTNLKSVEIEESMLVKRRVRTELNHGYRLGWYFFPSGELHATFDAKGYLDQINAEGLKTRHDNDGGMVVTGVFET